MPTKRQIYLPEIRVQIGLAIPALLAQISMVSMGFVDMVMTGRVGAGDMAAVALAGSLWMPIILFGQGILMSITPSVAQLRGSGSAQKVGHIMRQGLWLSIAIAMPLMLTAYFLSFRLEDMGVDAPLAERTGQYLRAIVWGGPAYLMFVALRCVMEGMALMRPAMIAGFLGLLVNIPCNYILIFGKLGFPALGGPGTGVATAIVYWVMFLTMLLYAFKKKDLRAFISLRFWERPTLKTLRQLTSIGLPGALAMLFEVTLFAAVALLIAPLGVIMVAGHQVALNFSSLLFMVPLSIGMAATIRTGYGLGRTSPEAVRVASRASLGIALLAAVGTALVTIFLRDQIAAVYNNDPVVLALASHLLIFAATYQLTDALQVVSVGILRGYNDTRAILCITLVSYWMIALPLGFMLGRTTLLGEPMGAQGFWIAFIVGITISAVMLLVRVVVLERRMASDFSRIRILH